VASNPIGQSLLVIKRRNNKKPPDIIGPGQSGYIMKIYSGYGRSNSLVVFVINREMNKADIKTHENYVFRMN
jgi:hypothetical protein